MALKDHEDNKELFAKYNSSDIDSRQKVIIRNKIVENNQALVPFIVNKYYGRLINSGNREDILQEGTIGLMKAIDAFDITVGNQFSTCATWWIRQAVNQYFGQENMIHIPSHIRTAQNKVLRLALSEKHIGSSNSILDIVYKLLDDKENTKDYSDNMVASIKNAFESKNLCYVDDENSNINIGDEHDNLFSVKPDKPMDQQKVFDSVLRAYQKLSDKEKKILDLRFNLFMENEVGLVNEQRGKRKQTTNQT